MLEKNENLKDTIINYIVVSVFIGVFVVAGYLIHGAVDALNLCLK
jgi:hypothetical protein